MVGEIIAKREFSPLYIYLDIGFLLLLAGLLIYKKKYLTVIIGLIMGVTYMVVDYGMFHLIHNSRSISEGHSLFWVLLWMSMSYGFTNFVWIWLWLSKDEHLLEWSLLILLWWFVCPLISAQFTSADPIIIQRTTSGYHGTMAIMLLVGYLGVIIYNLWQKDKQKRAQILWMLAIGVLVQFGWEAALLISGIRSSGFEGANKLQVLITNSLLETNLGMPYVYIIHVAVTSKISEQLKVKENKLSLTEQIKYLRTKKVSTTEGKM
ncbi:MAG: hypothetical protein GX350_03875 [Erysipelotrichaceae bacterium]|nr:hypothetical protein [Erysipelotrichaceae bacterium]